MNLCVLIFLALCGLLVQTGYAEFRYSHNHSSAED